MHDYSRTISYMTTAEFTFSYMLRNSGEVLDVVEYSDVRLGRRDGADLLVGTVAREEAVRDGLSMASRVLARLLSDDQLASSVVVAMEEALPWVGWLDASDRRAFADDFVRIATACRDTDNYGPMAKMLNRWKESALIVHSPDLRALLTEPRGEDERVTVTRPGA